MLKQNLFEPEPSDEILAARIAQRDSEALELLYDRFASRMFTLAAMLSDCDEAERIVLQVFSRLWLEVDQFGSHSDKFQDWFLNLARSHILNSLLRNTRRTAKDRVEAINRWLSDVTKQKTEARGRSRQPRPYIRVWQRLQDLPIEPRCVIILASYGGYKQKEIAQLLDLPLNAVEKHTRLGLKELLDTTRPELVSG